MEFIFIFQIIVLLFSVVVHEVSHGLMALELGDHTARLAGRLTLNPIKHLDPFGSVILPIILAIIPGGIVFGWAKPVPYNPYNLKDPKKGGALIAAAGPLSNLALAFIFSIAYRLGLGMTPAAPLIEVIIIINIVLAIFNIIPIPPLDGSKILFWLLPRGTENFQAFMERYGFIILIVLIFSGLNFLFPIIKFILRLFIGA